MDLQKKRDELQASIQANAQEIVRLTKATRKALKAIKQLDKLIATYNDLTGELDRVTETLPE
jgi:chromosome segregation ATPase